MSLQPIREEIDRIDRELITLLKNVWTVQNRSENIKKQTACPS